MSYKIQTRSGGDGATLISTIHADLPANPRTVSDFEGLVYPANWLNIDLRALKDAVRECQDTGKAVQRDGFTVEWVD